MTVRAAGEASRRHRFPALAAALLIATSACADGPTAQQETATATPTSSSTEPTTEIDAGIAQRLDAAIEQAVKAVKVPGAIVGVWGPEGRYIRAFGVADKATGTPMKTDFYSRIGSVTKTFTVTGVLQLADQGKLGLDDPIAKFVDGVPDGDKITLRQLARMQSGLFNYTGTKPFQEALFADPRRHFTPAELLGWAFAEPSTFPPGSGFEYSNTNTVLLGLVVEKVGGQPLHDYIRDHISTPLGMSDTIFPTDNAFPGPARAGLHRPDRRRRGNHRHRLGSVLGLGGRRHDLHAGGHAHVGARAGDREVAHPGDAAAAAADRRRSRSAAAGRVRAGHLQSRRLDRAQRQPARLPDGGGLPAAEADDDGDFDQHRYRAAGLRAGYDAGDGDHQGAHSRSHLFAQPGSAGPRRDTVTGADNQAPLTAKRS